MNQHEPVWAVETEGLTKQYKEVKAVSDLSMQIPPGEIYGFLGRNGAGKTTTIRMLLGLAAPTAGEARIFGKSLRSERLEALRSVGSLVETATAYPTLTVRENLDLHRRLIGCDAERIPQTIEQLKLEEYADRRFGKLSLGNKQRAALARALLGKPRLLVLDEPSNGLDPAGIVELRGLLKDLARRDGVTVFVSSHLLGEVSLLADRIGIIHEGRLIRELGVGELAGSSAARLRIDTDKPEAAARILENHLENIRIEQIPDLGRIVVHRISADTGLDAGEIARLLVQAGIELRALVPLDEDLESLFLGLTGGMS